MEQKTVAIGNVNLSQNYSYTTTNGATGTLVSQYSTSYTGTSASGSLQFSYTYDGNGNITGIARTDQTASVSSTYNYTYTYDEAGQLISATDTETGHYYEYIYDQHGNIMSMACYQLNADGSKSLVDGKRMLWEDQLYRIRNSTGTTDTYYQDAMGNLIRITTSEGSTFFTWGEGRMLTQVQQGTGGRRINYTYSPDGLRTKKAVTENGVTQMTEYVWGANGLAGYRTDTYTVIVLYDQEGSPVGFTVNHEPYTYVKNLQGDVIRILDANGNTVVSYTYDPWGVPTVTGDADLAALNPCSYRGYDYDEETGYYYLQSRYYDPEIGRFINADVVELLAASESVVENNLFTYCASNPIMYSDPYGYTKWLIEFKITDNLIKIVDFLLVLASAFLICFAAVKLKVVALKVYNWLSKNAIKRKLKALLTKCAVLIVDAIHTVIYELADTVPSWALKLSTAMIIDALLDLIDQSPAEIILTLMDRYDSDGKSGYVRYIKI